MRRAIAEHPGAGGAKRSAAPRRAKWLVGAICGVAFARPARAGNEAHVRTPVLWPSECAVTVERGLEPIVHFDYAVPVEDTELTPDELPDSRTHQFVALCRDRPLTELLPPWITRDDVERSLVAGLIDAEVEAPAILDEAPAWAGCFVRITADDDRRPITFAQAAEGFDWDTSGVEPGVWFVVGQTFEPAFNLWTARPGFVKIVDDRSDPAQDVPALALLADEQVVEPGATIELEGCADALGPATLELEWAAFAPELVWRPLTTIEIDGRGPVELAAIAPSEAAELEILVRATLTDAEGRSTLAHAPARITVLPCPDEGCPEGSPEPGSPPQAETCACTSAPAPPAGLAVLAVLSLVGFRRRP